MLGIEVFPTFSRGIRFRCPSTFGGYRRSAAGLAIGVALTAMMVLVTSVGTARAAGPEFSVSATNAPSGFRVGDLGSTMTVSVRNVGTTSITSLQAAADPIVLTVGVPKGLRIRRTGGGFNGGCVVGSGVVTCTKTSSLSVDRTADLNLTFAVEAAAPDDAVFSLRAEGAGVAAVTGTHQIRVGRFRPFGVNDFKAAAFDASGAMLGQAGAHPVTASTEFKFNRNTDTAGSYGPVEDVKSITTDLPVGFVGNLQTVSTCSEVAMTLELCPADSQVGTAIVDLLSSDLGTPVVNGVFRIEEPHGVAGQLGFAVVGIGIVYMVVEVRSDSDYGVRVVVPSVPSQPSIQSVAVTLWGTPADSGHDVQRCARVDDLCVPTPSSLPVRPFLTNPFECRPEVPVTRLSIDSWQSPGVFKEFEAPAVPVTGCDKLTFEPEVDIAPTTNLPDAPTGLSVDMRFPAGDNAEGLAPPPLKKAVVTLPEGMTINPSGAGGLAACTDAQLKLRAKEEVTCPDAAKVGSVTATSPLLKETLSGGVYIRSQNSSDPESGEMFRIALVLENEERGLSFRLPGQIRVNKQTGRVETTFDNNPQLPVENIQLRFKDGPRAPLATPMTCGSKTSDIVLTSWGRQVKTLKSTFNVACLPGLGSFGPGFRAGSADPTAAGSSPFNLLLTRADGHDVLDGLRLEMPEGLLANLKGNVGTQVGTVTVDAGPGSQPYRFPGKVYLEGPYADAPFSLKVVVPAKAGPFDLGEVVVRQRIYVDPTDAHVTVVSDPIPTIVEGVPVRLRNMQVSVDKPGFMINPTSCAEKRIDAVAHSLTGKSAHVAARFQVGGCAALPLKPKMNLKLTGAKETGYHKHPGLSADVTQVPGESGLKKVTVSLPLSLALDPDNAKALCKPEQAAAKACPEGSIIGDATAVSPVLNRPLTGHVYFVEGLRTSKTGRVIKTLPKLWVALRGEVALDVWADSAVKNRRLVNTFATVPDAPISSFNLNIKGGANGILKVTGKQGNTLCKANQVADARFDGQNGKRLSSKTRMSTPCGFKPVSSSLGSASARVTVGGLGKGRLTLSGDGIRRTSRSVSSEVVTVDALLSQAGRRASRANRTVRVKVTFKPAGGKAKTVTVSVKRPKVKGVARR